MTRRKEYLMTLYTGNLILELKIVYALEIWVRFIKNVFYYYLKFIFVIIILYFSFLGLKIWTDNMITPYGKSEIVRQDKIGDSEHYSTLFGEAAKSSVDVEKYKHIEVSIIAFVFCFSHLNIN